MKRELFLVDTSVWLFVLGRRPELELLERVSELVLRNRVAITSPIVFELLRGTKNLEESSALWSRIQGLHVFPYHENDWVSAAAWANGLSKAGWSFKSMDLLIAYQAWKHKLVLMHADKDFDNMARYVSLRVESFVASVRPNQ